MEREEREENGRQKLKKAKGMHGKWIGSIIDIAKNMLKRQFTRWPVISKEQTASSSMLITMIKISYHISAAFGNAMHLKTPLKSLTRKNFYKSLSSSAITATHYPQ